MDNHIHISSLVVRVHSPNALAVKQQIESRHDAEVHLGDEHHKMIVVLETASEGDITRIMSDIDALPGVLGTSLVYHHCETEQSLDEELA